MFGTFKRKTIIPNDDSKGKDLTTNRLLDLDNFPKDKLKIAKDRKVIPDPIDDRKFQE